MPMPLFDQYVAQSRPSRKRQALIIASVGLHAIAALVIIVWSVIHVDEIVAPLLTLTFLNAEAPAPPPPPPAGKKSAERKVRPAAPTVPTTELVHATQPEPTTTTDETSDDPNGQPDGQPDGDPNGVPDSNGPPGGSGPPNPAPSAPRTVASFTLMAAQLQHPDPHLPEFFRNTHAHQTVSGRYRFCLRTDGQIGDVSVVSGIPGMDQTVISQIKSGWTYRPQPVPVCTVAVISFKIN